jgi:putative tricarboxylic transport membrane protein
MLTSESDGGSGRMKSRGRLKEKVAAGVLLALSLVYLNESLHLRFGQLAKPGLGFIPVIVGVLLTVCTAIYLIQVFRVKAVKTPSTDHETKVKSSIALPVAVALNALVYPMLLRELNFLLSTFLLLFSVLVISRYRSTVISFFLSVLIAVSFYFVFYRLLGVVLPSGPLEHFVLRI